MQNPKYASQYRYYVRKKCKRLGMPIPESAKLRIVAITDTPENPTKEQRYRMRCRCLRKGINPPAWTKLQREPPSQVFSDPDPIAFDSSAGKHYRYSKRKKCERLGIEEPEWAKRMRPPQKKLPQELAVFSPRCRYRERQRCIAAGEPIPEWAALRKRGRPRKEVGEILVVGERKAKLIKPLPPRKTGRRRKLTDDE
jgi:hypothetical protein